MILVICGFFVVLYLDNGGITDSKKRLDDWFLLSYLDQSKNWREATIKPIYYLNFSKKWLEGAMAPLPALSGSVLDVCIYIYIYTHMVPLPLSGSVPDVYIYIYIYISRN